MKQRTRLSCAMRVGVNVFSGCAATILALPVAAGGGPFITPLIEEGDAIAGVGAVVFINNFAVNNSGTWMVEVDTDALTNDVAIIRNGVVMLREGDSVAANQPTATISSFDSVTINNAGEGGHNHFLANTGSTTTDSGIYFTPAASPFTQAKVNQEGEAAPGFSAGTLYIGYFDAKINDARQLLVMASVDDPAITSTVDRGVYRIQLDANGAPTSTTLLLKEGDALAGQGLTEVGTGPHASAIDATGSVMFVADLDGATTIDGAVFRDSTLLAQEGSASPVAGRNWLTLSTSVRMDLNATGGYVHTGVLAGDTATDSIIVHNGVKFMQEGDLAPAIGGGWAITGFGAGPVEVDNDGDVLWYADWDNPDTTIDEGLYLNSQLLIQEGVTTIGGVTVDIIRAVEDGYHMSDDGSHIIVELVLADGTEGAYMITFAAPCPADTNGDSNVNVTDLLAVIGAWGATGPNPADVNNDGTVNVTDLLAVIGAWGACP